MNCESCGMPMQKPEEHGAGDVTCKYCCYCAPEGKLRTREEIRTGWIEALVRMEGTSREEAAKKVDQTMPQMPAWKE